MRRIAGTAAFALAAFMAAGPLAAADPHEQVFDAAWKTVNENFYDPHFHGADWAAIRARYRPRLAGVTDDAALQKLIGAMLGELKSSHLYISRTTPGANGVGIGARIEKLEGVDTVLEIAPLSDSRAKGLKVGDRIMGGTAALSGPAGSIAQVTVQRCDGTTARLAIRRERWAFPLEHPGFRWSRLRISPDKVLGYIRVDRFDDGAAERADEAMAELAGTHGIVIDVRANSGGNISALQLASYFADGASDGAALFTRPYLEKLGHPVTAADIAAAPKVTGRYYEVYKVLTEGGGGAVWQFVDMGEKRYRKPVVVLIGRETGSAGEGFAMAMKMKTRARLIGEPTAGYILSGEDFDIAPGWSLTVPTAGNWSPDGENLGDKPVTPHETVAETRADLCAGRDRGAERAVAILTGG